MSLPYPTSAANAIVSHPEFLAALQRRLDANYSIDINHSFGLNGIAANSFHANNAGLRTVFFLPRKTDRFAALQGLSRPLYVTSPALVVPNPMNNGPYKPFNLDLSKLPANTIINVSSPSGALNVLGNANPPLITRLGR